MATGMCGWHAVTMWTACLRGRLWERALGRQWRRVKSRCLLKSYLKCVALLLLLAGCATPVASICPAPVTYTAAEQARAADELDALAPDAMLRQMMADYGTERARLRAVR